MKIKYYSEILNKDFVSEQALHIAEEKYNKAKTIEKESCQYLKDNLESVHDLPKIITIATTGKTSYFGEKLRPITKFI